MKKSAKMRIVRIQWHKGTKSLCVVARLKGYPRYSVNSELSYSIPCVLRGIVCYNLKVKSTDWTVENFIYNCLNQQS